MKIIVKDLKEVTKIEEQLDLNSYIKPDSDLIALDGVLIKGIVKKRPDHLVLSLAVSAQVIQKSAKSLKPVEYDLTFDAEIVFSNNIKDYDYVLEDEILLDPIIYAYIETEKPYRVFAENEAPIDQEDSLEE